MQQHRMKSKKTKIRRHTSHKPSQKTVNSWKKLLVIFTCCYILLLVSATVLLYRHGFFRSKLYSVSEQAQKPSTVPVTRRFEIFPKPSTVPVTRRFEVFPKPSTVPVKRQLAIFPSTTMERKSPCFGPKTFMLKNESSESFLHAHAHLSTHNVTHIVQYLSKFNYESVLHVPDWADRLLNDKSKNTDAILKPRGIRAPYFLSAVVRLRLYEEDRAKLTMAELKQWIHYQLWAGAEHIYICNHFLEESERVEPHLKLYIDLDLITVYPWNNISAIPGSQSYNMDNSKNQDGCYNHVIKRHSKDSVWQYNMDMDEYPYVPGDQCEGFFRRYLFNLDTGNPEQLVSQVKVRNYLMKGVGDRTRDMTIDRINRIDRTQSNPLVKPCYKLEYTTSVGTHGVITSKGQLLMPPPHEVVMVHYWGGRTQNWGPDTEQTLRETVEFNEVRETIAVNVRHSLLTFADFQGFSNTTGP